MNSVIRFLIIFLFLSAVSLFAQDVQEIYNEAKSALTAGDYETALLKISIAQVMIEKDPNLDPNGNFTNRLLPTVEKDAKNMESVVKALEELNSQTRESLVMPDTASSGQSVEEYTLLAKNARKSLLAKRDSILALYDLDPQYSAVLSTLPAYQKIETAASEGVVDQLSQKFSTLSAGLTDSLNNLNARFELVVSNLEKMKKSATANRAEREKLEKVLARISEERMNYLNSLSEMLMGEASAENPELQGEFIEKNVDNIFSGVIQSEIKRIQSITEADSATYKDLMKNYERIKNFNKIFLKNNITSDQSALLAEYEQAIKSLKVEQPAGFDMTQIIVIVLAVVIVILIFVVVNRSRTKPGTNSPGNSAPPVE
jgi:hypothetical protein